MYTVAWEVPLTPESAAGVKTWMATTPVCDVNERYTQVLDQLTAYAAERSAAAAAAGDSAASTPASALASASASSHGHHHGGVHSHAAATSSPAPGTVSRAFAFLARAVGASGASVGGAAVPLGADDSEGGGGSASGITVSGAAAARHALARPLARVAADVEPPALVSTRAVSVLASALPDVRPASYVLLVGPEQEVHGGPGPRSASAPGKPLRSFTASTLSLSPSVSPIVSSAPGSAAGGGVRAITGPPLLAVGGAGAAAADLRRPSLARMAAAVGTSVRAVPTTSTAAAAATPTPAATAAGAAPLLRHTSSQRRASVSGVLTIAGAARAPVGSGGLPLAAVTTPCHLHVPHVQELTLTNVSRQTAAVSVRPLSAFVTAEGTPPDAAPAAFISVEPPSLTLRRGAAGGVTLSVTLLRPAAAVCALLVVEVAGGLRTAVLVRATSERVVFGVPPALLPATPSAAFPAIPVPLALLRAALEANNGAALDTEGVFRLAPDSSEVAALRAVLAERTFTPDGGPPDLTPLTASAVAAAHCIKVFLRELPAKLLTAIPTEALLAASSEAECVAVVERYLAPPAAVLLAWAVDLLAVAARHAPASKMSAGNLAVCVGPNLFETDERVNPMEALMTSQKAVNLLSRLITARARGDGVGGSGGVPGGGGATPLSPPAAVPTATPRPLPTPAPPV